MNKTCFILTLALVSHVGRALEEQKSDNLVRIGIDEANRQHMSTALNTLLANEYVLYTKTLKWHWDITGAFFGPLHKLFKEQYSTLFGFIDRIAERIRALGFYPSGTLQEFITDATIEENPRTRATQQEVIATLLSNHQAIIQQLRPLITLSEQINDMGSNNFLSDLLEKHEKMAWMLRAHLL